jgi:pimeloyl-ACP methyl ester carboxylesterase
VLRLALAATAVLAVAATVSPAAPSQAACVATNATFRTSDGATLRGAVIGRGPAGIVFAHQVAGDRCQWLDFARELAGRGGYRVLVFDMRGYGASSGSANVRPDRDVAAAAAELRRRGAKRVILVGASMGGTGVVAAAPGIRPAVSGVVELSAPVGFGGVNALPAVRKLKAPALFVAGRDDGDFPAATRALYKAAASRDKQLVIAATSWHGVDLVALPAVKKRVLDFIARVG